MKLIPLTCIYLKKAKKAIVSNKYIIILTGRCIIFLNKKLEYIKTIEGLKYAYNGIISPDGTKLLVVSNDSCFYVVSLETLDMVCKCRIKGGVVGIEGQGAWSLDSQSVKIITVNQLNMSFSIRTYPVSDPNTFYDDVSLGTFFQFHAIITIPSVRATFILARRHIASITEFELHSLTLLRYDESGVESFEINNQKGAPLHMEYNERIKRLIVYTTDNAFTCDLDGKNMSEIDTGTPNFDERHQLFPMLFVIKQIVESLNGKYLYMASTGGFDIFNHETGELIYHKDILYGSEGITEIEEGLIIVNLYGGSSKLYRIQE